jgi:hypothetical protein
MKYYRYQEQTRKLEQEKEQKAKEQYEQVALKLTEIKAELERCTT